jgi:pyruvate/2-oxoglutarate dehydrogenase complex dihydrolipoamide dehydrogenase (E3) component
MDDPHFDVVIIGAGQAGPTLATSLAKAGRNVALVERKDVGGSCVNFGCTPTKAVIASARVAHLARRAGEFGLRIPTVEVDYRAVLERARQIVLNSRKGLESWLEGTKNLSLLRGHARFEGRDSNGFRLRVGEARISAQQVVLDTGTRSLIPPIEGLKNIGFLHAGNWLDAPELPRRLVIIGGGYIGLEMAQFYRRMGSEVVVLESAEQVAGSEDPDLASALQKLLESEGIEFHLNTRVEKVESSAGHIKVTASRKSGASSVEATQIFVATGRQANTDDLGLETVGVNASNHGIVEPDKRLSTNVRGIWVAGDIRGGPMFTHTAWDDYRIIESQIIGDGSRTLERVVPYAVFTDPQLGRVGITEQQARKAGRKVKIGRFDLARNGKANEVGETSGFIKVVVDAQSDRLLGAAVLANEGAELVHIYIDLMNARAPFKVIRDAVFIHPTLAEALQSAVAAVAERSQTIEEMAHR